MSFLLAEAWTLSEIFAGIRLSHRFRGVAALQRVIYLLQLLIQLMT